MGGLDGGRSIGRVARHLITSALPYINGVKHLGNLVGSMLPADVHARFLRSRGDDVLFICATDEHGTPAELAALEAGEPVDDFCRRWHELQADLGRRFALSFDHFGRSSSPQNHELTQHFARRLRDEGYVEERVTAQVYSHADGRFLPDRYVVGTCPHCGYEFARGDQCENCTRLLDPTDLIAPRSAVSGSTDLEIRDSRHLFLLQSKLAGELEAFVRAHPDWPPLVSSIALKWLDEGLGDRGITRDLAWGVPVPPEDFPGLEGKVFYVWFDAPIEYIGATKEWADAAPGEGRDWRSWWWDAGDVTYTEFMAKDNVPFHTIGFPATLIGSREPWTRVERLKGFNWLTYYGGKFSTSRHVGVFMDDALELLPSDYWRWFLMANAPETSDSSFTWELFQATVNKDLADVFGNFVNRTLSFAASRFDGVVPEGGEPGAEEAGLLADVAAGVARVTEEFDAMRYRRATAELRAVWTLGNGYLERQAPWKAIKGDELDRARAARTIRTAANLIRLFAVLAAPVIPDAAVRVLDAVGATGDERTWPGDDLGAELDRVPPGRALAPLEVLFRKVTDDEVAAWRDRFAGGEAAAEPLIEAPGA